MAKPGIGLNRQRRQFGLRFARCAARYAVGRICARPLYLLAAWPGAGCCGIGLARLALAGIARRTNHTDAQLPYFEYRLFLRIAAAVSVRRCGACLPGDSG